MAPRPGTSCFLVSRSSARSGACYAAAFYRGYWFWIDDGDWQTKRALSAVMFFFTLGETGGTDKLPQVTIPTQ